MDAGDINLSLDEIIKKKNIKVPLTGPGRNVYRGGAFRGGGFRGGDRGRFSRGRGRGENYHALAYKYDARNTIAAIKRTKTVDARDKLGEIFRSQDQDIRERMRQSRSHREQSYHQRNRGYVSKPYDRYKYPLADLPYNSHEMSDPDLDDLEYDPRTTVPAYSVNPVQRSWYNKDVPKYVPQSTKHYQEAYPKPTYRPTVNSMDVDEDGDDSMQSDIDALDDEFRTLSPLDWLVSVTAPKNPLPPPSFSSAVNNEPDPFDHYHMMTRPSTTITPTYVPTPINETRPLRGILRTSQASKPATVTSSRSVEEVRTSNAHLSQSMRNRLEHAPNPNESMGIFAKMPPDGYTGTFRPPSPPSSSYRIIVSNLHVNVTQQDIQELFEEVNNMIEARLVRPGVAEVIYGSQPDAEQAVETYHNRYLDGQPMKCLLVNPRQSYKPTKA
uniref:RRM domain-containing protein n=1 Tax=Anopheles farauti TaxID=69004 RepID=A0A182Q1A6_9DIPT